jgi:hypothetical protein
MSIHILFIDFFKFNIKTYMEWFNGLSTFKKVVVVFLLIIGLILLIKLALLSRINLNTIEFIN